jgi:uncharacterized protein (TIGR02145 family)
MYLKGYLKLKGQAEIPVFYNEPCSEGFFISVYFGADAGFDWELGLLEKVLGKWAENIDLEFSLAKQEWLLKKWNIGGDCVLPPYLEVTGPDIIRTVSLDSPGIITQNYTLKNTGSSPMDWDIDYIEDAVISVYPSSGNQLASDQTATVTAEIDTGKLSEGTYRNTLNFNNLYDPGLLSGYASGSTFRQVKIKNISEDADTLSLSKTSVSVTAGNLETVSVSVGTGYYSVSSSNSNVATVSLIGNEITIAGVSAGTAVIIVNDTGGGSAAVDVTVTSAVTPPVDCGAYVAPGVWKEFDCYNLAAIGKTTGDDPFTPSWRLIGGYWQWGWKGPDPSQWYDTNTEHFAHGPTGPGSGDANSEKISNWDGTLAIPNGYWSNSYKAANDPCPAGYRVPSKSEWQGMLDNMNGLWEIVGTWSTTEDDHTNYTAAHILGRYLMLPAAGLREFIDDDWKGALFSRGSIGSYWSSSENTTNSSIGAANLIFSNYELGIENFHKSFGLSVRCISEE